MFTDGETMKSLLCTIAILLSGAAFSQTTLDTFVFDDGLFGNTLFESDNGNYSFSNWLNVSNEHPGNPSLLTGANFDTGIANIGMSGNPTYTIGYDTAIINNSGDDLGVVVARYTEDTIRISFSADGSSFTSYQDYGFASAIDTGVHKSYYYGGGGPSDAELFVQPIDLSDFGISPGAGIYASRVTGFTQLDLVRVAGFQAVPEPTTILALVIGAAALLRRRRQ